MKKVISLDIGGTNSRFALINENKEIETSLILPTKRGSTEGFISSIIDLIKQGLPAGEKPIGIAAGVPGRVRKNGFIDALPNVGIENVPLGERLKKEFGIPTFIKNDAEIASLAEANSDAFKEEPSLFFVTISTGFGGALTENGRLAPSSYEIGHTLTKYKGQIYEFEHLASGTGLVKLSELNGLKVASSKEFFSLLANNEPKAIQVKKEWISIMADWFKMVQKDFRPSVFALTGGVLNCQQYFLNDLIKACPECKIRLCSCGQEAGLIGASIYGFQNID